MESDNTGYHNIDTLPLGKLLQTKQLGGTKTKRRLNISKLIKKGFK